MVNLSTDIQVLQTWICSLDTTSFKPQGMFYSKPNFHQCPESDHESEKFDSPFMAVVFNLQPTGKFRLSIALQVDGVDL